MFHRLRVSISVSILFASLLAGCTPIVENHGHNLKDADFSQVVIGQSRKEDVQALLGSPSAAATFGDATWYYIALREETVGPKEPQVTEQKIIGVRFDSTDTVVEILEYATKDGKPVVLVEKITPAQGKTLSFFEQLLGNIGRFNAPSRGLTPTPGSSPGRI
jgi:outer membrane protein assembly factor BamE (lipoprotein component of BamABCDE complex)